MAPEQTKRLREILDKLYDRIYDGWRYSTKDNDAQEVEAELMAFIDGSAIPSEKQTFRCGVCSAPLADDESPKHPRDVVTIVTPAPCVFCGATETKRVSVCENDLGWLLLRKIPDVGEYLEPGTGSQRP